MSYPVHKAQTSGLPTKNGHFLPISVKFMLVLAILLGFPSVASALDESNPYPRTINVWYQCDSSQRWTNQDIESYLRDTLPNEWGPGWPEQSLKAGAVMVRTVGWQWIRADYNEGLFGISGPWINTQNGNPAPQCAARQNFISGTQGTKGNNAPYGTNKAVNNTFGLYIGTSSSIPYINYGADQQNGSYTKAQAGERFIEIVKDYYSAVAVNPTQPIAVDSGDAFYGQIEGAYYGFGDPLGHPYNNGGSEFVHRWGPGYTQDFRTAPTGGTASVLMIPDVFNGFAFWVPGSIWPTYLGQGGGGGWMGYPLGNQEFVPSQSCGGALESSQKFQSGYIIWNCSGNALYAMGYTSSNISVYFDISRGGKFEYFLTGAPDLRNNYIGNDTISSLAVPQNCSLTLYQDVQYGGQSKTFYGPTEIPDLRVYPCSGCSQSNSWNDATSAITTSCANP